jgi:predicted nucleic acid-binding protein
LAFEIEHPLLVLDDRAAREYAKRLGLELTGTLGLLLSACKAGLIDDKLKLIQDLRDVHFYIPSDIEAMFM